MSGFQYMLSYLLNGKIKPKTLSMVTINSGEFEPVLTTVLSIKSFRLQIVIISCRSFKNEVVRIDFASLLEFAK